MFSESMHDAKGVPCKSDHQIVPTGIQQFWPHTIDKLSAASVIVNLSMNNRTNLHDSLSWKIRAYTIFFEVITDVRL